MRLPRPFRRTPYAGPDAHLRAGVVPRRVRVRRALVAGVRARARGGVTLLFDLAGIGLVIYSAWLIWAPAAYFVGGVSCLAIAWVIDRPTRP